VDLSASRRRQLGAITVGLVSEVKFAEKLDSPKKTLQQSCLYIPLKRLCFFFLSLRRKQTHSNVGMCA
jgi:hypothetical protein